MNAKVIKQSECNSTHTTPPYETTIPDEYASPGSAVGKKLEIGGVNSVVLTHVNFEDVAYLVVEG